MKTIAQLAGQSARDTRADIEAGKHYPPGHQFRDALARRIRYRRRLWERMPDPDVEREIRGIVGTAKHAHLNMPLEV